VEQVPHTLRLDQACTSHHQVTPQNAEADLDGGALGRRECGRAGDRFFMCSGRRRNTDRRSEAGVMTRVGDDARQTARRIFATLCAGWAFARS